MPVPLHHPPRDRQTNGSSAMAPAMSCCNSKSAWRDGTTHIKMSPLKLMQRLAALVPRSRLHLIRFHGVLAPVLRIYSIPGAVTS